MEEELGKVGKGFMIALYIITGICILLLSFVIYNIATQAKPWTLSVTYADVLSDENQTPIVKVSVKNNVNKNGESLYEIQFNSYTDTEGNGVEGFGIQCVGDFAVHNLFNQTLDENIVLFALNGYRDNEINSSAIVSGEKLNIKSVSYSRPYHQGDFYFYKSDSEGVCYAIAYEDIPNYLLIDVNGAYYRLTLKDYTYSTRSSYWGFNVFKWGTDVYKTEKSTFTWYDVFAKIIYSAILNNQTSSMSEFSLNFFDLADYLTIEYKNEKGQYLPVDKTSDTRLYLSIPVTYSSNGAINTDDSYFGMVKNSSTWSVYDNTPVKDYWNAFTDINLTEQHVNLIANDSNTSYIITFDETFKDYLSTCSKANINFNINLDNFEDSVLAIDMSYFDFRINELKITSSTITESQFQILNRTSNMVKPTLVLGGEA
ncbi:MAG: hypothetical protein ACI4L6_00520 [Candidatus Onthoplasma sp.]